MIGKTIKALLTGNSTLTALVTATKMFPYVMNEDTDVPCIIYTIDSIEPEYTKKEWVLDNISFTVTSFHRDYGSLQPIVTAVRGALELKSTGSGTQDINKIYLRGFTEGYDNGADVFYTRLTFQVKINTY
jgi:hypothetical protein